jgi:hypothetical protein
MVEMPVQDVCTLQGMRYCSETGGVSGTNATKRASTDAASVEPARKIAPEVGAARGMTSAMAASGKSVT